MYDDRQETLINTDIHLNKGDADYPERLMMLTDPPDRLTLRGAIPKQPMVAIVGSRKADPAACRFASRLAGELTSQGIIIISGGALGIDTAAHMGALDANGSTVAVIGSGFNHMYPEANRELFGQISQNGALVTEFANEQPPAKWTFPKRNRIVAAMAGAVIVVEAGERSGALITANKAKEIGVPVGAVPGIAGDPCNRGSNGLIRRGAAMVETLDDVLTLLDKAPRSGLPAQLSLPVEASKKLSETEQKVLDFLGSRPLHLDEISVGTGLEAGQTGATILSLEILGLVEDQGGRNFVKVG